MFRKEIGWIDFIWGTDKGGIKHLIKRRSKKGIDGEAFARELPEVIAKGRMGAYYEAHGTIKWNIIRDDTTVVLSFERQGDRTAWIVTGFPGAQKMPWGIRPISEKVARKK